MLLSHERRRREIDKKNSKIANSLLLCLFQFQLHALYVHKYSQWNWPGVCFDVYCVYVFCFIFISSQRLSNLFTVSVGSHQFLSNIKYCDLQISKRTFLLFCDLLFFDGEFWAGKKPWSVISTVEETVAMSFLVGTVIVCCGAQSKILIPQNTL